MKWWALRYGPEGMGAFWHFMAEHYEEVPTLDECGSIDPRQALDKQAADTCLETVETGERREVPQDDEETLVIKDECYHEGRRSELHQK